MIRVEIDINNSTGMNAVLDFESWEDAQAFASIVVRQGYIAKIWGIYDEE